MSITEYLKFKYTAPPGTCKCDGCQLVPAEELAEWRQTFRDLAIAADTAELMLRKDYPAEAQSLRAKVGAAKALTDFQ